MIKEMKLSNTNQRRVIIEELRKLKSHPTAEELYCKVKRRIPLISLATVYRNLDVLSEAGEVLRLEIAGKQKRFDGDTSPHYHLRCKECGAVEDIMPEGIESARENLEHFISGRICNARLEFDGYCRNCYSALKKAN